MPSPLWSPNSYLPHQTMGMQCPWRFSRQQHLGLRVGPLYRQILPGAASGCHSDQVYVDSPGCARRCADSCRTSAAPAAPSLPGGAPQAYLAVVAPEPAAAPLKLNWKVLQHVEAPAPLAGASGNQSQVIGLDAQLAHQAAGAAEWAPLQRPALQR